MSNKKKKSGKIDKTLYEQEMSRLQKELVKLQEWVKETGEKVVILFEGRDAAGKGGVIARIAQDLNPRIVRIIALAKPTDREQSQWYFQRYVQQLPAAGEICMFDRSWYNAAGVDRVMGFLSPEEVKEFLRSCPDFERMIMNSGIRLIKFWFSVSSKMQDKRFKERLENPSKRWKFSPMDLESRDRWEEYSQAKDEMFAATDTRESPWWVVEADDKKKARLNCISHLLNLIPYQEVAREPVKLPPRPEAKGYTRPPISIQHFVPELF